MPIILEKWDKYFNKGVLNQYVISKEDLVKFIWGGKYKVYTRIQQEIITF